MTIVYDSQGVQKYVTSPGGGGGGVTPAVSGSNGSFSFSTLSLGQSNGLTFYTTNGSVVGSYTTPPAQTVQTQNLHNLTLSGNTAGVMAQVSSGTATLAGGNNITLSQVGNAITISGANTVAQSVQPVAISGSNGSFAYSTLSMGVSNGLTFYTTNGSIVGSYTTPPAQTVQPVAVSGANGSFNFSTLSMAASNGVSFSTGTQGLYATVKTDYAVSDHSHGNPTLALTNLSGTTASASNGFTLSLSAAGGGGADGYNIMAAGTQTANTTGTVAFVNGNGLTFGMSNNSQITASHNGLTQQSTQPVAASGSNGSFAYSTLSFGASNGATFYTTNGSIVASYTVPTQTAQPVAVSGSNGSFAYSTLSLGQSNGLTFYTTNGSVVGSHNALTSQSNQAVSGGNGSSTFQTLSFANSNGLSFSTGTQGLYGSYTVPTQTVQPVAVSGTNGSFVYSTLSLGNSNGLQFYSTNGSIVGSYTVPTQSAQTANLYATGNTTQLSSTAAIDVRSLSFEGAGIASVGVSNGRVLVSVPSGGGAGDGYNIVSMGSSGNTTGTAWSTLSGSIGLYAQGAIQISQNNSNQIVIIDNDGWRLVGANTAGTSSTDYGTADRLYLSGNAGVTLSGNSNTIVLSVNTTPDSWSILGNTAGASNTYAWTDDRLYLAGGNNITLSQNGSTLTISAGAGGGAAFTGMWFQPEVWGNTVTSSHANGTLYLRPVEMDGYYDNDYMLFHQSGLTSASTMSLSASVSAGSASSGTGSWGQTGTVLWFSRAQTDETAASYNSIVSFDSKTVSLSAGYSASVSWSTNASSATASWTTSAAVGFVQNIGSGGGFTTGSTGTSGSSTFSSTSAAVNSFSSSYIMSFPYAHMSGVRPLYVPQAGSNMPPGEYWVGVISSTNTGSTNYALNRVAMMSAPSALYFTGSTNNYMEIGNSVAVSTSNYRLGFGSYSASSNTTGNIALSQVSLMASNASLWLAVAGKTK